MQLFQYPHPPSFSSKIMNNTRLKTFVMHCPVWQGTNEEPIKRAWGRQRPLLPAQNKYLKGSLRKIAPFFVHWYLKQFRKRAFLLNCSQGAAQLRSVLEFQNNLWWLGTEQEQGCRTGPPGYIGWRNRFLGSLNKYRPCTNGNAGLSFFASMPPLSTLG